MADDIIALSFRGLEPTEADFEAIQDAFMETARGRWFLSEYARRNRHADTTVLLAALNRIESLLQARRNEAPEAPEANPVGIKPDGTVAGKGVLADAAARHEPGPAPVAKVAPGPRPAPVTMPDVPASFVPRDPILLGDDDPMPAILAAAEKMARLKRGQEPAPVRPVTLELRPVVEQKPVVELKEKPEEPKAAAPVVPAESEPAAPRPMPSARLRGIFNEVHRARWGSQAETAAPVRTETSPAADVAKLEAPRAAPAIERKPEQNAEPSPAAGHVHATGNAELSPKSEPAPTFVAANDETEKPAAMHAPSPQAHPAPPQRPMADDPLAAIVNLSDEEKIALFS